MATALALCRNGSRCSYLANERCKFRHPEIDIKSQERVENPFAFVFVDSLFNVIENGSKYDNTVATAEKEILRRIEKGDKKECLKILQDTVQRQDRKYMYFEEKALSVMTRSYSYFNETLWEDFAIKNLSHEAFKKLCSAAKKAKHSWDKSQYGSFADYDPEDSNSEDEYGQLNCPSMQEDFKAILNWIQRGDIEEKQKELVLAVFKTNKLKSKVSVIHWMEAKIKNWERKEKEEEEEMKRIEEEVERDRALGIPLSEILSSGIPGPYGARLDARTKDLCDLIEEQEAEGHSGEVFNKKLKNLLKQCEEEDKDGLYEKSLEDLFLQQFRRQNLGL